MKEKKGKGKRDIGRERGRYSKVVEREGELERTRYKDLRKKKQEIKTN